MIYRVRAYGVVVEAWTSAEMGPLMRVDGRVLKMPLSVKVDMRHHGVLSALSRYAKGKGRA